MDNIYDTLAKLNKVANAPEIVKEDSNALMKKGLEDLMKKTKFNKDADYKPFGKGDKDYETGLPKDAKKDKMFDDMKAADAAKMNKQSTYKPFGKDDPDYETGLPKKGKDKKMFEKESDVERDDRAEKAGREVAHDAKYDGRRHAGKDGKDVTKDIEYDEKHDKDGMHEGENSGTLKDAARQGVMARLAELAGLPVQEIEEALGTPQDVAAKIMAENPLDEAEVEEGNEFSGERDKAIKAGKDSFEVDGKTYPVKGDKNESLEEDDEKLDEGAVKDMMQDVEEGMDKKEFEKKYPGQNYDEIKKDIEDRMNEGEHDKEEKVEETTSSGSVATGDGAGKPLFKNASIYEKYEGNEIAQRAFQINEDMSISVHAGTDSEPSININASGEDAGKMMELCKLAGIGGMGSMGMGATSPGYVEVDVTENENLANGADATETMDTEYMTQDIAGGLNGPKKMAYPKVAGADNPMSVLGESELNEVSEDHLMKLYQEYKAK